MTKRTNNPVIKSKVVKGHHIQLKHGARGLYFLVDGKTKYIPGEVLHMDERHIAEATQFINTWLVAQGILPPALPIVQQVEFNGPAPVVATKETCRLCPETFAFSMKDKDITEFQAKKILKLIEERVITAEQRTTILARLDTLDRFWASKTIHKLDCHTAVK